MTDAWADEILLVIPSLNGGDLLARMLPTLRFPPSGIVVIDQGSTDATAKICADLDVAVTQLGHPHTYTQACNIGASLARERGRKYVCVANNDITFRSDVLGEMHAEMERDPTLGIVAPAQIVFDPTHEEKPLAYRVFWNLDKVEFLHDTEPRESGARRLESDFCELTCALIRMSAIEEIGFLDDEYGFYHEDADFGFRLRKAGYNCAYLPGSQINHFIGSTMSREKAERKADYIAKNKRYFARKHLGFGFGANLDAPEARIERSLLNQGLQSYIWRLGLVDPDAPDLVIAPSRPHAALYLYSGYEGPVPDRWIETHKNLRAAFTTSARMRDFLTARGLANCRHVPPGVEPDIFQPWGGAARPRDAEKTYLAIVHGQLQGLLRTILLAWSRFVSAGTDARLILYGPDLGDCLGRAADRAWRAANVEISRYEAERIEVHDVLSPLNAADLARLYRSCDYTITGARGEDAALAVLQSAACGTPCIAADAGAFGDFSVHEAVTTERLLSGRGDQRGGGSDASCSRLLGLLEETYRASDRDRNILVAAGVDIVRSRFTARHTAMAFHRALSELQIRRPSRMLARLDRQRHFDRLSDGADEAGAVTAATGPSRLGGIAARRVETLGRVMEQFGATWRERGFGAAGSAITTELKYFITHRSRRIAASSGRAAASVFQPNAVLLIGYIDAQLGLGESLRGLALAMSGTGIRFGIYPFGIGVEGRRSVPYMPERYDETNAYAVNVIEVATNEMPNVLDNISASHFDRSYNILRTYWELGKAPEIWRKNLERIDEMWVPNAFVADSFRAIFDRAITIVPPCVNPGAPRPAPRESLGLDEGEFYFMFSFDYYSFPQRKNPLGVVRAFRRAFPDPTTRVGLVIKSAGAAGHFPVLKNDLRLAAQDDPRIRLIDESLTRDEMLALIAAVDCYVSLHRSEGFGLGMAESMALGKPVIATDYSGSTDFLSESTGYPIPRVLRPIAGGEYIHPEGQVWADPDEAACAAAMIRVFINREEAHGKADAARRFVAERYGTGNVGRIVEQRLTEIFSRHGSA